MASVVAGLTFLRRRIPRFLTQASKRPLFKRKHKELVSLFPASTLTLQLPLRSQTLALTAVLIANIVEIVAFYTPTPDGVKNYDFPEKSNYIQLVRYFSNRTGILSVAQLILVFLLSGRNLPTQLLTFGAMSLKIQMVLHRWMARMSVMQTSEFSPSLKN